jgi:hypothetical protein
VMAHRVLLVISARDRVCAAPMAMRQRTPCLDRVNNRMQTHPGAESSRQRVPSEAVSTGSSLQLTSRAGRCARLWLRTYSSSRAAALDTAVQLATAVMLFQKRVEATEETRHGGESSRSETQQAPINSLLPRLELLRPLSAKLLRLPDPALELLEVSEQS